MKKIFILTFALCFTLWAQAQRTVIDKVTITNNVADQLDANLAAQLGGTNQYGGYLQGATTVMISGALSQTDLNVFMQNKLYDAVTVDWSGVTSIGGSALPANLFAAAGSERKMQTLLLPDNVLTSIGDKAFYAGVPYLTGIVVPKGVTSIGKTAFANCAALTSVTLPDGLLSIGDYAFQSDGKLASISIPESVTTLGVGLFSNCRALASAKLPSTTTVIPNSLFSNCNVLSTIDAPFDKIISIGSQSFRGTKITSISLPALQQLNGSNTFTNCTNLTSVTIPANVTVTNNDLYSTFSGTALTSFDIPTSVTTLTNTFTNTKITSFTVPASITTMTGTFDNRYSGTGILESLQFEQGSQLVTIGDNTFAYTLLTSVALPEGVTTLGASAFAGITSLKSADIPSTVTGIAASAFSGCTALTTFVSRVDNVRKISPVITANVFAGIDLSKATLYVPEDAIEGYQEADVWKDFGSIKAIVVKQVQNIENFADISATFGDNPITLTATATSGLDVTYTIEAGKENVAALSGNVVTIVGAGSAQITASQAGNDNYAAAADVTVNLTVSKTAQTITGLSDITKTYGDADFALTATASSTLGITYSIADASVATVSTSGTVHILKAGSTTITASQAGNDNYHAAADVTVNLTVSKVAQTISGLFDITKRVGDADFTLSANSSSGLTITYSIADASVATVTNGTVHILKAGTTTLTASQAGNDNYAA
ncbi:MAG: leucine-rich repeat domain-containing protein, partial [Bacteroidales bacterium]|nr:leucine-rich repeat domain-containing protein [Bacteroidales bacterium]